MKSEYDLVNELGEENWIDSLAGEAVVIGHLINDPQLVADGTSLARIVREINYSNDNFYQVEAMAEALHKELEQKKLSQQTSLFIDNIHEGDVKHKPDNRWEYDFVFCGGVYEVLLTLPRYLGELPYDIKNQRIRESLRDYEALRMESVKQVYGSQEFRVKRYFDKNDKLVCRMVDHDHEDCCFRGVIETHYFDNFEEAKDTWQQLEKIYYEK